MLVKGESVADLTAAYFNSSDRTNSSRAFGVLLSLGPYAEEAIPSLLDALESTNSRIRLSAMNLLGSIGAESERCVAVMTNLLTDPDSSIRYSAANALVNSGPLARHTTPMVLPLLDDHEELCRISALNFLRYVVVSNEFAPYRAKVQQMTNDSSELVRSTAEWVLREQSAGP